MPETVEFRTSVRELVAFAYQRGDLAGESQFRPSNRAVEGTRGHRRLQKARGKNYEPEIAIQRTFQRGEVVLHLSGRVDGVDRTMAPPLVEEIKTVDGKWAGRADPVHLAQARIYAAILAEAESWPEADVRLTYFDLETNLETDFRATETREALSRFLEETIGYWFEWLIPQAEHLRERDVSLKNLNFPFGDFRAGQRELARHVYRTIRDSGRFFVEAPTGLGKTMAALYPAVKALPLLREGQIFYITAKTPGRFAAEEAVERLRTAGAKLRSVSLTAKGKICFRETEAGCDLRTCPFAVGYYDRVKPALRELLTLERLDRSAIEEVARRHTVCPFELSLDASLWTDLAIGDFNYVFDPSAQLQRHFAEGGGRHVVLVDEAHNLVDRSREMHSATLSLDDLDAPAAKRRARGAAKAKRALAEARAELERFLGEPQASMLAARPYHEGAAVLPELPGAVIAGLKTTSRSLEQFLADQPAGTDLTDWLEIFFALRTFLKAAEAFDETCRLLADPARGRVTIFCADPSRRLREVLKGLRAAIFFSATLSPLEYFRDLLGGEAGDICGALPSPFRAEQMAVTLLGYDVTYRGRASSLPAVARAVKSHIASTAGNHLIFCPSLDYLGSLAKELSILGVEVFCQSATMDENEREKFLARFQAGDRGAGLAVLGGIFSEGVDLPGDRLVGVTVIGVGLPRLSLERDVLQDYFVNTRGAGFDYAYRFPGMQRVLQAAGRLIRTEQDCGTALLIDRRFAEQRYRDLFPSWWQVVSAAE